MTNIVFSFIQNYSILIDGWYKFQEDNDRTEILLKRLNKSGKIHMVPAALKSKYVIRFTVTSQYTTDVDIERDWKIIQDMATKVLRNEESDEDDVFEETQPIPVVIEPEVLKRVPSLKKKDYGMSLLLSNVPSSPKLINGSFAALFDNNDVIVEFAKEITNSDFNGRPIRLSPRRRMKLRDQNRQRSLDCDVTPHRSIISRFKQASLDSKVDEILEWSTLQEQTGGLNEIEDGSESGADSELDAGSGVKMKVSINVTKSSETDDEPEKDKGELPNGNGFHSANDSVNGHIICQHCGHVING